MTERKSLKISKENHNKLKQLSRRFLVPITSLAALALNEFISRQNNSKELIRK